MTNAETTELKALIVEARGLAHSLDQSAPITHRKNKWLLVDQIDKALAFVVKLEPAALTAPTLDGRAAEALGIAISGLETMASKPCSEKPKCDAMEGFVCGPCYAKSILGKVIAASRAT